jgi:hypothetical protein
MQANWTRTIYASNADFTAVANTASEASLIAGTNLQPTLVKFCLEDPVAVAGKSWRLRAAGVLSTTGTPSLTFKNRLSATAGTSQLGGASVGSSAAITTINNSANAVWLMDLVLTVKTPGVGSGNCTLNCGGFVHSPGGFASPFSYHLVPTAASPGTWTQTVDGGVDLYWNVSATWGSGDPSNTITCKSLVVEELR